jgi:pyrimidine operon attenuation protein/uracil phosphoribosyltransferase
LAESLREKIRKLGGMELPLGILDITFYRDDLTLVDTQPVVEGSHLNFDVNGKKVLLVDDVLNTGRTTRAALESVIDYGRPKRVELVVLVDRGHRELPIQADYVGKYVETAEDEVVEVRVPAVDGEEGVFLTTRELLKSMEARQSEEVPDP